MTDLAKLVVKLEAESSKLRSDLAKANARLDHFAKQTQRAGEISRRQFDRISASAK